MANRNISATVQIGATMSASVGAVFGSLKKRMDDVGGSLAKLKKRSSEITKLQAAQGKLTEAKAKGSATAIARYSAQVAALSTALEEAGVDTKNLAKEQDRLAQSIGRAEQQLGRFKHVGAVFDRLKTGAKGVGEAFGTFKERLGAAFTRLGVVTGVLAGAAAGVGYLTAEFVDQGDALADQAEGLNMSTKALQTWQFAAGTVGIESEKLGMIISKLQSKITEGSDGTKEAFAALGVNFSKLRKMSPEQQLTHITEAFSRLPDTVNKTALANEVFGKSGYKLLPVLNAGAAGLKEIYDEAKRTGYILGDDTNDAVNKADAAFNQLKLQLTGFKNQALAPLLPVFTDLVGQLGRIVIEHGPKLTAWVQTAGKSFMENLAPAIGSFVTNDLPPLVSNLGQIITQISSMVSWVADAVGGWGNLGAGLVALNFAPVIASVVSLTSSLWTMGAAVVTFLGPWGLLAVAVGAAAVAIYKNWGAISEWWTTNVHDPIYESIGALIEKFTAFADFVASPIQSMFGSTEPDTSALSPGARAKWQQMQAGGGQVMPAENMPGSSNTNNVKQDFQINVTAPSADPAAVGGAVKSAIKNLPLYDSTGVLAPQ